MKSATPKETRRKKSKENQVQEVIDKTFLILTLKNKEKLYVIPEDIKAVGAHVSDGTHTKIYVSGLTEQLIVIDRPENVVRKVAEFKVNKKDK